MGLFFMNLLQIYLCQSKTCIYSTVLIKFLQQNLRNRNTYKIWVYPKITISQKFLLFYPNPKGDKRNFKSVSVYKWETP
jgi:hypothetical protein